MGKESKKNNSNKIKFLCSYGGKIIPRHSDGKLRYVGGYTRILAVDRSISCSELMVKLGEFCGYSVMLRCQLPIGGDLDTLVSITSDEELASVIEEYDNATTSVSSLYPLQIRAILSPPKCLKTVSPPVSNASSPDLSPHKSPRSVAGFPVGRDYSLPVPVRFPLGLKSQFGRLCCYYSAPSGIGFIKERC